MAKRAGSGSASGSIPTYQNVTDPEHCFFQYPTVQTPEKLVADPHLIPDNRYRYMDPHPEQKLMNREPKAGPERTDTKPVLVPISSIARSVVSGWCATYGMYGTI
jgi:hypothetical protein